MDAFPENELADRGLLAGQDSSGEDATPRLQACCAQARKFLQSLVKTPLRSKIFLGLSGLLLLGLVAAVVLLAPGMGQGLAPGPSPAPQQGRPLHPCTSPEACPPDWVSSGSGGGYFCRDTGGCRPGDQGPFPNCPGQCYIGNPRIKTTSGGVPAPGPSGGAGGAGGPVQPQKLVRPGRYDLRVMKAGKLLGCAAPIGIFPGQPKYGCSGDYATAETCDAASNPVKDTQYVAAVHRGCETEQGRGTYGYAYDDGVGLKQCSPLTKYEWVLCPDGSEAGISWSASEGVVQGSTRRFRVTNRCSEPIWIQQAGTGEEMLPGERSVRRIEQGASHTYSIPNRGLPSTRFLPKTGCDASGNACDVQSMPPCPTQGCDLPIDTKFEASWGCVHARGTDEDASLCALTGQGNPSTYQDWWDGSAVDGWTLPFSVLVDDGGRGLAPGSQGGSPSICGNVVCAGLDAAQLCPQQEFLTPEV